MAFSPDGKTLAWIEASPPDTIHLWDVTTRSIIALYEDPTVFNINTLSLFHLMERPLLLLMPSL